MEITINDIKRAILAGGDVSVFIPILRQALAEPPVTTVPSLELSTALPEATALLRPVDDDLASLLNAWLVGKQYKGSLLHEVNLTLVGLAPYGRNISRYLERIIDEIEPDIVALDVSPVGLSTNMLYSFSLPGAVGLPVRGEILKNEGQLYSGEPLYPGNMYQTAILKCWLGKVPLIPVGMPLVTRRVPREETINEDYLDKELAQFNLLAAYHAFDESLEKIPHLQEGAKVTPHICEICSSLSDTIRTGISEKIVEEANYIASRITEVGSFVGRHGKPTKLLAIVDIKHYQDIQYFINFLKKGIIEEVYLPPRYDVPMTLTMVSKHSAALNASAHQHTPEVTLIQELFGQELEKLSMVKDNERLAESEVDNLIAAIVIRSREHPDVARGASVRGAIAFKEVLRGFGEIQGVMRRSSIEKAALVTLPPRISTKQGNSEFASDIVSDIVKEVLYGFRSSRGKPETVLPDKGLPDKADLLSPEDIMRALQNLTPGPLSQEQEQQLARQGQVVIVPEDSHQKLAEYLASKDFQQEGGKGKQYSSSQEAIQQVKEAIQHLLEELERRLGRGEITEDEYQREKSKLEEMLSAASQLESQMSGKELAETVMEFMDAKDRKWAKDPTFQDMYTYYHIKGTSEGKPISSPKRSWYGLRVVIDYLEKQGLIRTTTAGESFTLTAEALNALLEHLIPKSQKGKKPNGLIDYGKGQLSERDHNVRRYTLGDVFRDISVRHTLREIAKQKKNLSDMDRRDFRVFMKQPHSLQSDIVFCVDSSGSMGYKQKLIYARLAAAGLARAALQKRDRVGLVTFDDLGRTILPLTNKMEEISNYIVNIKAVGNTNIGDGIKCATDILLHGPGRNRKYIVLITDSQPTAISEKAFSKLEPTEERDLAEEYAILETRKASSRGVRVSVIHVSEGKKVGRELATNIARAGRGQVRTISSVEDIRLMAQ